MRSPLLRSRLADPACSATNLPLLPHHLQSPVALKVDLLLKPREHVLRRDVACGAVQSDIVVMVHVIMHRTSRVIERQRRSWPDVLPLEGFVPALDLWLQMLDFFSAEWVAKVGLKY